MRDGIVYVTEERKAEGFLETMSLAENVYIGKLSSKRFGGFQIVSMAEARMLADAWREQLNIRAIDPNAKVILGADDRRLCGRNRAMNAIIDDRIRGVRAILIGMSALAVSVLLITNLSGHLDRSPEAH